MRPSLEEIRARRDVAKAFTFACLILVTVWFWFSR